MGRRPQRRDRAPRMALLETSADHVAAEPQRVAADNIPTSSDLHFSYFHFTSNVCVFCDLKHKFAVWQPYALCGTSDDCYGSHQPIDSLEGSFNLRRFVPPFDSEFH